jgi:membrane protein implicated in regulation of membrane protease activity
MVENPDSLNDEDDYSIASETPDEQAAREAAMQRRLNSRLDDTPKFEAIEPVEESLAFSIRDVFLLTGLAAVVLSVSRFVTPDVFAGTLGLATFLGLIFLAVVKPQNSIFQVGWWVMLALYLMVAIVAMVRDGQRSSTRPPSSAARVGGKNQHAAERRQVGMFVGGKSMAIQIRDKARS